MLVRKDLFNQLLELAGVSVEYLNEKWITVKPHGADSKGVHVKVEDGETSKEAVERKFDSKTKDKKESSDKKQINFAKQFKTEEKFIEEYNKLRKQAETPFGSGSMSANTSIIYESMNKLKNIGGEFELRKTASKEYYFQTNAPFGQRLDKFYQEAVKN